MSISATVEAGVLVIRIPVIVLEEMRARGVVPLMDGVSTREREVFERLVNTLSNKEIAADLCISESTVKFHVSNILRKFKVESRAELVYQYGGNKA